MFFLPEQKKKRKKEAYPDVLFNSVTIALKGLNPSKSNIIGLFSQENIRFLSDYNKKRSNKSRELVIEENCTYFSAVCIR